MPVARPNPAANSAHWQGPTSNFKLQMAIAHFKRPALGPFPLARAAPVLVFKADLQQVLVFKADLQPQPEAVPSDSGLTSDSESGCHSQAQAAGPGCYSPPVGRKPKARATLKLPFKFKFKLR